MTVNDKSEPGVIHIICFYTEYVGLGIPIDLHVAQFPGPAKGIKRCLH